MLLRKTILTLVIFAVIIAAALYFGKEILLDKLEAFAIKKAENYSGKGIRIWGLDYLPFKGITAGRVSVYKTKSCEEKILEASGLSVNFSLRDILIRKTFSPTISAGSIDSREFSVNGVFGFSMKLGRPLSGVKNLCKAIRKIDLLDLNVRYKFYNIENIRGNVQFDSDRIEVREMQFAFNEDLYRLNFEVSDISKNTSITLSLSSPNLELASKVKKQNDIFEISEIKGHFRDSVFSFVGEFENLEDPSLSLYGDVDFDIKDIGYFLPGKLSERLEKFNAEGAVKNSVYFKGKLSEFSRAEIGIKSTSQRFLIFNLVLNDLLLDARIKNAAIDVPMLTARPYGGTLISHFTLDFASPSLPYEVACKIAGIDMHQFFKDTDLREIQGLFSSEFILKGNMKNLSSMTGSGNILVTEANLGPVPLLAPFIGMAYGYLQSVMPPLKKVTITEGCADFRIADKKIITENLVAAGDTLSAHAKGYVDFDGNIDLYVENKFLEPEEANLVDWQDKLQGAIADFGKMISDAHLTGTIKKPQWKFEHLGASEKALHKSIKLLEDIF
jgi:hypothetical protein